jgi:outer membrane biogenesis lipoprotein LolB
LFLEVETETIERELEQQFKESLQSKIAHTHHGGLGFHADSSSASSSGDWKHQPVKSNFVPAKTEVGSSMDHVKVSESDKKETKDKKTKSKS